MNDERVVAELIIPKQAPRGGMAIVVVDRIEPGIEPAYQVFGKSTCYGCDEWCWLGGGTYKAVAAGDIAPVCMECARRVLPKDAVPSRRIEDR